MTQQQYIISRKLNILELGQVLGNISEACRKLGVSRQHYYDIKRAIEEEGLKGLLEKSRRVPRVGNRVAPEIEQKLLDYSLEFPTHGQVRAANELKRQGIQISAGGVRSIWLRHNIQTKALRLRRLERWAAENTGVLTESQVQALEAAKEEEEASGEIESHHPGYLIAQDTCYLGYIKGIGRLYQQTSIDTYSNVGFAKLYLDLSISSTVKNSTGVLAGFSSLVPLNGLSFRYFQVTALFNINLTTDSSLFTLLGFNPACILLAL